MKTYRLWALAMVLAFPVLASAAEPAASPGVAASSHSDDGMEMTDLIAKVAKRTGKQFIVDPRVRAIVSNTGIDLEKVDYAKQFIVDPRTRGSTMNCLPVRLATLSMRSIISMP